MKFKFVSIIVIIFTFGLIFDSIVNFFFNFPFLVSLYFIIFPFILYLVYRKDKFSFFLILVFILIFILGEIRYGFHLKDLEVIQILIFFASAAIFRETEFQNIEENKFTVKLIFILSFLTILSAFFGINAGELANTIGANVSMEEIEYARKYNQGLFRIPQIAAYIFGFLFLYFLSLYKSKKYFLQLIFAFLCFFLMLFTGVRTVLFALVISYIITFFKLRRMIIVIFLALIGVLFVHNLDVFLDLSRGTVFYQYFTFVYSVFNNFSSLSRVQIWSSWLNSVSDFSIIDLLIGKTFFQSTISNFENLGIYIWFHNDLLGISYSFGLVGITIYLFFIQRIYKSLVKYFSGNRLLQTSFLTIILCSVFNGFYYYVPILLLYIIFSMKSFLYLKTQNEKQI